MTKYSNVIKSKNILFIQELEAYHEKIKQDAQNLLNATNLKCKELEEQLYTERNNYLAKSSQEIYDYNQKQYELILQQISSQMANVVHSTLIKCGFGTPNTTQICNIILNEIDSITDANSKISLICNPDDIDDIKAKLAQDNSININKFSFTEDAQIPRNSCTLESKLGMIKINKDSLLEQLNQIF